MSDRRWIGILVFASLFGLVYTLSDYENESGVHITRWIEKLTGWSQEVVVAGITLFVCLLIWLAIWAIFDRK